jgi:predicted ABC-type ATPase
MTQARRPVLVVVAGANGSGKTTLTLQLRGDRWLQGVEYLNPDAIAEQQFGGWNDPVAVLKAAEHVAGLRERALLEGRSLAFETVFSAPDKLDYLWRAKQAGFFVRLFFVSTDDPITNVKRVAMRVMEGGHEVPIGKIVSRYKRCVAQAAQAAQWVDRFYLFDNSIDDAPIRRVLRAADGRLVKQYCEPPHAVARLLRQALIS